MTPATPATIAPARTEFETRVGVPAGTAEKMTAYRRHMDRLYRAERDGDLPTRAARDARYDLFLALEPEVRRYEEALLTL